MNKDITEGKWEEVKGKIKKKWGQITDNDLLQSKGSYQETLGIVQKKYGEHKEEVAKELKRIFDECEK